MKNKVLLGILVAGGIIGGFLYYTSLETTAPAVQKEEQVARDKKMAFSEFVNQGGSYKCTVNQNTEGIQTTGTVFIDKNSTRGMFETVSDGKKVEGNFLVHDGYSYFWSSASPMGMKTPISAEESQPQAMSETFAWNPEQVGDYSCEAWVAGQAVFSLPSGVEFVDLSQIGGMYKK